MISQCHHSLMYSAFYLNFGAERDLDKCFASKQVGCHGYQHNGTADVIQLIEHNTANSSSIKEKSMNS